MKKLLSKIFTVLLVLYPVIHVYDSPIGSLCLADILLLLLYPFLLFRLLKKRTIKIDKGLLFLLVFVLANLLVIPILHISDIGLIIRNQGHFMIVLITLAIFVPNLFEKKIGIRLLCHVSLVSSLYLIAQVILLHVFGIVLGAHLPFLTANISENGHIRPFAFFSEPAAFGMFNAVGLATVIAWKPFKEKMNRASEMIITFAMLLSLSSTAVALLVIVWLWYMISTLCKEHKLFKANPMTISAFFVVVVLFVIANSKIDIISFIYRHVAPASNGSMAAGVYGRLGNISSMKLDYSFHMSEVIFGHGMIDLTLFLPATVRTYLYFGVVGCVTLILYFLRLFINSNRYGKGIVIIVLANSLFGDSIYGLAMFWYMQYIMMQEKGFKRFSEMNMVCQKRILEKDKHYLCMDER